MERKYEEAHRHSSRNRKTLEQDEFCGCFHCLKIFSPSEINEWLDDDSTAVCPYCGIDSVIGAISGYSVTKAFLQEMHSRWF
jgi:hypothetical protein